MEEEVKKMKEGLPDVLEIVKVIRSVETDATSKALHAATIAYASGIHAGAEIAKLYSVA